MGDINTTYQRPLGKRQVWVSSSSPCRAAEHCDERPRRKTVLSTHR